MVKRTIVVESGCDLSIDRSQLVATRNKEKISSAPLEDLSVVMIDSPEVRLSSSLLGACGEYGIVLAFCGEKHLPTSILLPFEGHHQVSRLLNKQFEAKLPAKKRLWQQIVVAKIRGQAQVLTGQLGHDAYLKKLVPLVRSGDPDNVEARAAQMYFSALFGPHFVRLRQLEDDEEGLEGGIFFINSCLNYGYAVLRAFVARNIVLAGLSPMLGIWHHNRYNAFPLADDLMEPLRPVVDEIVLEVLREFPDDRKLRPPIKRKLVSLAAREVQWDGVTVPIEHGLSRYCAQVRECLFGERSEVTCPTVLSTAESAACG